MSDISKQLIEFVESEREHFSNRHNNMFAMSFSQVIRYYGFLLLILERHSIASKRFVENSEALQKAIRESANNSVMVPQSLFQESRRLTDTLHLEIESFYLFAKILLDKVSRFLEFYFGPVRNESLDSHDDFVKNFKAYSELKGLKL
jgi:hypothetical protein